MSSRRSSSACMQSQKFIPESQSHAQLSRILSTTCSKSSLSTSKSPLEPISFSCENIQGSSALLASELDKLIVVNSELTKEITSWKRKYQECFRLLRQNLPTDTEREHDSEIYKQKYTKLKGKALDLKKSYKILESAVIEKNKEIGDWKDKYEQMEQEYIDQIQNLRNQIEVVLRSHIEKEVNIAMDELEKENGLREGNWNALLAKVKESQNDMNVYREERDRALRQLEDNAIEMRDLQKEVKFLDQEQEKTIKQLNLVKEQLSAKEVNCQSIQGKCTSLNAELEKLRTWTKEQTAEQNKTKQEIENLKVEKEAILKSFEQTKEQLKAAEVKYKEAQCKYILLSGEKMQGKEAKMNRLQEELNSVEKERDMLMEQLEDFKAELLVVQDKNGKVNQLEEMVKIVSQEKERVLSQLEERNRNNGEAEMRNNILKVEIETLRTLKEENISKINQLNNTLSSAKQEKETLSEENLALMEQKNKAVKQCEQTKGILSAVEKNYKNIYSNNTNLKNQVQSLEAAVSEKNTVLAQLEEAINTKTSEAYAKEIELKSQSEEIQLLREKIQSMNLELEALKTSQASNEGKTMAYLDEIKKREQTLKNLEGKVQSEISQKAQLEKEISELKAIITSLEQQVEAIKKEKNIIIEQYEMRIQNINIEMEALRSSQAINEGKTMTYLEEIKRRDHALRNLENKIQSEMSQKVSLEKEISELKSQHEKKIQIELEGFRKNQAFDEGKILAYQEEIKKRDQVLSTLESKIQAETSQKTQLEKEITELKRVTGKREEQCEALKKEKNLIIDQYEQKIQAQVERNSELVTRERQFRLKIDELSLRVNGNEELDKKVSSLLQENLTLRNGANEAQKVQSGLENKLKGLEIILDQLKSALEGEKEIGGMLRKIEEYKRNTVKMDGEFSMWKKKCEEQELRVVQEIEKVEAVWKRRMETEVEGKNVMIRSKEEEITKERMEREIAIKSLEVRLQTQASKLGENETERKTLLAMNENLNKQINQLVQEVESLKKKQEEDIERESRLANTKLEIEREKRVQMEKEFSGIESQLKQRTTASEEQAKVLKAKVEDFELRQVMFFIEIERLYAINGELIEDINRLTHDLREASVEIDKNRQIVMEISKAETFGNPQKDNFDEVASDLKKQIEGFEKKLQTHFDEKTEKPKFTSSMPLRLDDLIIDTPVKKIEGPSFTGTKMNKGQVSSIQKSHAELRDLAMKFESEKKTMEAQLAQFKKLVDMNKLEMKRFNESDAEYPMSNPLSPTVRFEGDQFEQPRQSLYGSQEWKVMPGKQSGMLNFQTRLTSDGKENTQQDGWPLMAKSASSSLIGFRSPQYQKGDDDYVMTPRVKLFK